SSGGVGLRPRHLFRFPRGRAHPADRAPGGDAIRLRGSHRGTARPGRPLFEPPVARPGAVRAKARPNSAPANGAGVASERPQRSERHDRCDQPPALGGWAGEPRAIPLKPSHDKGAFVIPLDRTTIDPRTGILAKGAGGIGGIIARLQPSLDRLEQRQTAMVNSIADNYDSKARRM